ncbi:MAG: hypothetical protein HZB25_08685 [Candidatus Eisenbacteria bacterium]|nr:hypothetical protein [Candidatus Eisenbacteria bacterium]
MRIKKFVARTMPEALAAVKADLGDAAVLLRTRALDIRVDGKRGFEVTAAAETEPVRPTREPRATLPDLPPHVPAPLPVGPMRAPEVANCLVSRGVDELLARRLAEAWQKKSRSSAGIRLEDALAELIPVTKPVTPSAQPHVIALVGPTGAGKTTTLAKLAAHFVLEGKYTVQLLTADTHRIAAVDQLAAYARLLKVGFEVGFDAEELSRHRAACGTRILLVDTPGVGPLDDAGLAGLERTLAAVRPDETHMCLPAGMRTPDLRLAASRFARLGCDRLLFTKTDESATSGQLLSALAETRLPVSYWTTGPVVPGDFETATGGGFARLVLGGTPDARQQRARQGA